MTEEGFMNAVVDFAHLHGWIVNHDRPAKRADGSYVTPKQYDGKGFPDLFMLRPSTGHRVAAELKVGNNKKTPEQEQWLNAMERCGIAAFTWYPTDWEEIEETLTTGPEDLVQKELCSLRAFVSAVTPVLQPLVAAFNAFKLHGA